MKEQELLQLETRVAELKAWKESRVKERLALPLDEESKKILHRGQWVFTKTVSYADTATDLSAVGMFFRINGRARVVMAFRERKAFTAATTDIITTTDGQHNLLSSDRLVLSTTGTLPAGLTTIDTYYPVSITATTFKVSLTEGGAAVDITDTGTGTHYYSKI